MQQTFSLVRRTLDSYALSMQVFLPVCFLAVVMLYMPSLNHPLVLDDRDSIERNPFITQRWLLTFSLQTPPGSPLDCPDMGYIHTITGEPPRDCVTFNARVSCQYNEIALAD